MSARTLAAGLSLLVIHLAPASAAPVTHRVRQVLGVPLQVVEVDVRNPRVRLAIAVPPAGPGSAETFARMVGRDRPAVAVTGTYFDLRSLRPLGDLIDPGRVLHRGFIGTALAVRDDGRVEIRPRAGRAGYPGYRLVLAGGPVLVASGKPAVNARAEGFRDPGLFRRARRAAAGITTGGRLLLVVSARPVSLTEMARLLARLGAREAINLDGGTSTALYHRGRVLVHPGRALTNLLIVHERAPSLSRPERRATVRAGAPLPPRMPLSVRPGPAVAPAALAALRSPTG